MLHFSLSEGFNHLLVSLSHKFDHQLHRKLHWYQAPSVEILKYVQSLHFHQVYEQFRQQLFQIDV